MDADTQQRFAARLAALKAELLKAEETGHDAEATVELDQTRTGRLTRMDALQQQAMSVETGHRRRAMLREIEQALARLADDEYGFCEACGEDIAIARLEIQPTARLCIACAEASET